MNNKYIKPLVIVILFLIITLVTVVSYAYFTASVNGNTNIQNTVITTGTMSLEFIDGPEVSLADAIPGSNVIKTFKVKNTGTVETTYDIYLSELINLFEDKNDLVYTLTSTNGCASNEEKVMPSSSGEQSKLTSCSINANQEHEYTLTITFKDNGTNQDDNKGKIFKSKININEYKTIAYLNSGDRWYYENSYKSLTNNNMDSIKYINRVYDAPDDSVNTINIKDSTSSYDVLMWFDEDTIKLYTPADEIYMNENSSYMFSYLNLKKLDLNILNATVVSNMNGIFSGTGAEEVITGPNFDTSNVKNMRYMFENSKFDSYDFVNDFDYSNVEDLYHFFGRIEKESDIELRNINFSKAKDMRYMFVDSNFKNIKITNVEAPKVENMDYFFKQTKAKTIKLENSFTNGTSLERIEYFVYNAKNLEEMDLGSFNIKGIKRFGVIFSDCPLLKKMNLGNNFNTSETIEISMLFLRMNSLEEIDLGENFYTTSLKNIPTIASDCPVLKTIHLGNKFNVRSNQYFFWLVSECPLLTTIYIGPDAECDPNAPGSIMNEYYSSPNLVGGAGTTYDSTRNSAEYFRIDNPEHGKPGLLTLDPRYA